MIQIPASHRSATVALGQDFISDKQPLTTAAGFKAATPFAGQARQTFSLLLSESTVAAIRAQLQPIYDQLITDCWPPSEPLPFDMIRFDAFLDPASDDLKILEMNTRNVGLHEVVEWLDGQVASALGVTTTGSLNRRFVANQKRLHGSLLGSDEPLLYLSSPTIPLWTYFDELTRAYPHVKHVTASTELTYSDDGVSVDGQVYRAIIRKMAWPDSPALREFDENNQLRLLQPRWMRPFGLKNYLQQLTGSAILRTETYSDEHLAHYQHQKDQLVLKIINGGGSHAVYLGALYDAEAWQQKLDAASAEPEKWIMQDYYQPPVWPVMAHGLGERSVSTQLGIFILPSPTDPHQFDMDITVKGYAGSEDYFTFDPSDRKPDIWFGHVIKLTA